MLVLNKLVEVYFNGEFDKLSVGYIRKIDDEYIMLEEVDPRGFMDGYSFILKDNINIVKSDTEYLKGIEILMNVNKKDIINIYVNGVSQRSDILLDYEKRKLKK